jgi:apolipoprotein D and lipocalin family protein
MRAFLPNGRIRAARWLRIGLALVASTSVAPATALTPIADFDVTKYYGKWYEVGGIPGFFQNKCVRDVQTEYTADESGAIILRRRCTRADGGIETNEGRGRSLDANVPAVLKVTYVNLLGIWWYPFGRNQIVIAAGPDYGWLVIGDPTLRFGRILARQAALGKDSLRTVAAALVAEGYDGCAFVLKPQTGAREQETRLCDELR